MTVDGVEESRRVYNNSTYKVSNEIYSVGLANATPEAAAAINNAIATQNEDTIRSTVSQWVNGGAAQQTTQQTPQTTDPAANTGGQTASDSAAGTVQSGEQPAAQCQDGCAGQRTGQRR